MGCAPGTSLLVERGTGRDDHMRAFSALMLAAAALATPAWAVTRTLEVDSRLVECTGVAPMQCMRVRDAGETDWRVFHGEIENFAFEPGYRYLLQVEELPVENPPADGGSIRTMLVEMIRKLAVEPPADPFAGKVWRLHELQPRGDAELLRPEAMITLAIDTPGGQGLRQRRLQRLVRNRQGARARARLHRNGCDHDGLPAAGDGRGARLLRRDRTDPGLRRRRARAHAHPERRWRMRFRELID